MTACRNGDFPSAVAAIRDGASVNAQGCDASGRLLTPLEAAVIAGHHAHVLHLLVRGGDVTGPLLVQHAAAYSNHIVLQLLIDAGGDVNSGEPPGLFGSVPHLNFKAVCRVALITSRLHACACLSCLCDQAGRLV